jgi:hypothetical protein
MILVDHARRNRPITVINSRHEASSELVRLAARLVIEEALEGEAADALGRGYYARGGSRDWAIATGTSLAVSPGELP